MSIRSMKWKVTYNGPAPAEYFKSEDAVHEHLRALAASAREWGSEPPTGTIWGDEPDRAGGRRREDFDLAEWGV